MRFEQLECLLAVEETGSFSAAAQKLFLTQQAISMSMKQLEQEMGQPLLVRENKKIVFTPFGEEVLEFSRKMLQERDNFLNKAHAEPQEELSVHINICSNSCVANITLPEIIFNLVVQKRKPSVRIVQLDNLTAILDQVKTGETDIGLVSMNAQELERKFSDYADELQLDILARDEVVVVINRKDYQGRQPYLTKEEYLNFFKTLYNVETIDEYRITTQSSHMICSNDADFHRAMLEKGGTAVTMSELSYQYFFNNKKYISLPIEGIDVPMIHAAIYRKDADVHLQEFARLIRQEMHVK